MTRTLAICIISAIVFLATLVAYVVWYDTVATATADSADLASAITTRNKAEVRITAARTALDNLTAEEAVAGNYFVASADVVPFINKLESLGASVGAAVQVASVAAAGGASNPVLNIALTITGTFDHVMRAVGAIEYAPYDLTTSSLSFTAAKSGGWTANMAIVVGSEADASSSAATAVPEQPISAPAPTTPVPAAATTSAATTTATTTHALI